MGVGKGMSKRGHEGTFSTDGTSLLIGSVHVGLVMSQTVRRRRVGVEVCAP